MDKIRAFDMNQNAQEDVKKACGVIVDDAPSNMLLVSDVMKDFIDSESIRAQWKESTKVRVRSILNHIVKYNEKLYINEWYRSDDIGIAG